MKKLLCFAALVLGMASCQKDVNSLEVNVGEQEAVITVALPEATRANADSALSGLDNGVLADHDLRFILEIYSDGGSDCLREVKYAEDGAASTAFNVRLVPGHAYEFVVWADFVQNEADTYFDTTNGLDAIEMLNLNAMTEARDAYYGVASIAANGSVSEVSTITLTRPFAKVRVVANDVQEAKEALQKDHLTTAKVTYKNDVVVYNTFNARTQDVSVTGEVSKEKTFSYTSAYDESNLYVDYLLVPQGEQSIIKFDLNVEGFVNREFKTDIAVEANKLTTIKGNILTNGSDIRVEVKDDFVSETIYLEGDVTLTEDLTIDRPMVVRPGAKAVLNLNGHDIINNTKSETFGEGEGIIVYGNLTIKGQGTVQGSTMAVWARGNADAVVNIYGGTFLGCEEGYAKGGRSVVYASSDNVVNIYGGTVKALAADKTSYANKTEGVYAALNVADNHGMINVYGGSFYKQNPVAPGTEPAAWNAIHTNGFLAEGYVSVANGEWFEVVYTGGEAVHAMVNNATELNAALSNTTVTNIYLKAGNYGTIVAKSNKTIIGSPEAVVDCVNLNGANNLTLKNINFDAANAKYGYDGVGTKKVYAFSNIITGDDVNKPNKGAHNLVIDGCKFTGTFANPGAAISFTDQKRGEGGSGNVTIKNCVFDNTNSNYIIYAHYAGDSLNGHGNFVIENNIFKSPCYAGPIYLGRYASNIPVVVKDNIFEVVTSESAAMGIQDHSNYGVSFDASGNTYAE